MIRINLLSQSRQKTSAVSFDPSTNTWLVGYGVTMAVTLALLGVVYYVYSSRLEERRAGNQELRQRIARTKDVTKNLKELEERLARAKQLDDVVKKLESGRTGPTRLVLELGNILSADKGPTVDPKRLEQIRAENPLAGFNPEWDVRRLWLIGFEEENRECRIFGRGKTNDDVAEFLRRLNLSEVFENVTLEKTIAVKDASEIPLIGFELSCKVRY